MAGIGRARGFDAGRSTGRLGPFDAGHVHTEAVEGRRCRPSTHPQHPSHDSNRLAAIASVLAAVAALAGLLIRGLYVDTPYWVQQARGTDLATLLLAVPVLAFGLWDASRGSAAGRLAVFAGLLYLVYNYAIFAFSVAMNSLTAVHIAIFGLALWSLLLTGTLGRCRGRSGSGLSRRASGVFLVAVAVLFSFLWIGQIASTTTTGMLPPDLLKAGISTNPVYALDLAFFLPLCEIAGIGLLRRTAVGAFAHPHARLGGAHGRAESSAGSCSHAAAGERSSYRRRPRHRSTRLVASAALAAVAAPPTMTRRPLVIIRPVSSSTPRKVKTCLSSNESLASAAIFVAAHFAMGFINSSAGGSGGALLFPFATNAPTALGLRQPRWDAGSPDLPS